MDGNPPLEDTQDIQLNPTEPEEVTTLPASNESRSLSELHNIDIETAKMENINTNGQTREIITDDVVVSDENLDEIASVTVIQNALEDSAVINEERRQFIVYSDTNVQLCLDITVEGVKVEPDYEEDEDVVSDEILDEDNMMTIVQNVLEHSAVDSCTNEDDYEQINDNPVPEISNVMSVDTLEGHPMDEDPPLEDTQDIQLNPTEPEEVTTLPEDMDQTQDKTTGKPDFEDVSTTDGENSSENSRPLEKIRQAEQNTMGTRELRVVIERMDFSNIDTNGNRLNVRKKDGKLHCDICLFETANKKNLSSHLRAHAARTSYKCSMCPYLTTQKRSLNLHITSHTKEKAYACQKCDKKFSKPGNLRAHFLTHSSNRPYSCHVCNGEFKDLTTFRRHSTIHTGEKPHICGICKKAFRQTGHLQNHMRMHTGIKSFICNYCQKAFRQKCHLNNHMRIHTDGQKYTCPICDKIFRTQVTFDRHMKKHASKKYISCTECKKVFSQKSCLRVHFKKHLI